MKMIKKLAVCSLVVALGSSMTFAAENSEKFIPMMPGIKSIDMNLNGEKFTLMRNQSKENKISSLYDTTFRGVPQPIVLSKGVQTVGELEFIDFMKKAQSDDSIAIIDTRKPGWYARLRIPGAISVPYTNFNEKETAIEMMEDEMGVVQKDDNTLDFSKAKIVVLYCNGYWCGQTPAMIKNAKYSLLKMGYPAQKIKYYRGGMQAWTSLGLTVVGDEAK